MSTGQLITEVRRRGTRQAWRATGSGRGRGLLVRRACCVCGRRGAPHSAVFVSSQLVGGELELLQPDVRWGHAEPARAVHTTGQLRVGAGGGQPVSAARALQPTDLPL